MYCVVVLAAAIVVGGGVLLLLRYWPRRSSTDEPRTVESDDRSHESQDQRLKYKCSVEIMALLAVIYYACVAHQQWGAMIRQADIADQQLHATHRPWLEPDISIAKPLTFYNNRAEIVLTIRARNGGTAPAIGSQLFLSLVLIDASTKIDPSGTNPKDNSVLKVQDTLCNPQAVAAQFKGWRLTPSGGRLILPNSQVTYPIWGLQTNKPSGDVLAALITGCIAYVDEFESAHATLVTLLFAGSHPFKAIPGRVMDAGFWGLAPYGQDAY